MEHKILPQQAERIIQQLFLALPSGPSHRFYPAINFNDIPGIGQAHHAGKLLKICEFLLIFSQGGKGYIEVAIGPSHSILQQIRVASLYVHQAFAKQVLLKGWNMNKLCPAEDGG